MKTTHSRFGGFNFIPSWFKNIGLSKVSVVWLGALIFTIIWIIAELCKLNPEYKHFFVFLPISVELTSILVSGIGFFISFLGILSIIKDNIAMVTEKVNEVKKDVDMLRGTKPSSKNPFIFIEASDEDLEFVEDIKQCLISVIGEKLKGCLQNINRIESSRVVDTVKNCMNKINIESKVAAKDLESCTISVILYCKHNESAWIDLRVNSLSPKSKIIILLANNNKELSRLSSENKLTEVFNPFNGDNTWDKSQCTKLVEMMKKYIEPAN